MVKVLTDKDRIDGTLQRKPKKFQGANGKWYSTQAEADINNQTTNFELRIPNGGKKDETIKTLGYFGPADGAVVRKPMESNRLGISKREVTRGKNKGKERYLVDGMKNTSNQKNNNASLFSSDAKVGKIQNNLYEIPGTGPVDFNNIYLNPDTKRKGTATISRTTGTLEGLNLTDNYKNPGFYAPSRTKGISKAVQNARSKSAGTKLKKQVQNRSKLSSFGLPAFATPDTSIFRQSNTVRRDGVGPITPVSSPYGNFANAGFGSTKAKSKIKTPTMSQSQFSQNIKLLSSGKSLTDSAARASIAQASASSNARLTKVSRARNKAKSSSLRGNPNLGRANAILAEQGADYKIGVYTRRRRRGRWETAYVAIYTGPSTRRSYSRTIHNGRRVTAYRGYTTGQRINGRNTNPDSIVQTYERNKAISAFGSQQGISKNEGESQASHAGRVTSFAQSRKSDLDQYITPIDPSDPNSLYSYAAIGDDQIKDIKDYHGDLVQTRSDFDSNINILQQGLAKVQTARGKAPKQRAQVGHYSRAMGVYGNIESREKSYDSTITDTSAKLANIGERLSNKKQLVQQRSNLAMSLNKIMGTTEAYSLDTASSTIDNKITAQKAQIKKAEAQVAATNTATARTAARRSYQRLSRGGKRRYRSPSYSAALALRAEQSKLSQLQSVQSQISQVGTATWGDDKINSGIIATPGNRTITGARTGKNNWYRGAGGSTTIKIPKDKIPASGKVIIEANVSYTSGYKGRTHATGTFGTINKGSKTVRQELPVDANGNVKISMHMYGTKYGQQAKAGISNIKVIDPTRTQSGASLFGSVADLSSQQSNLQTKLRENQEVKNYFDDAQEFLTGKSTTLKRKGKTVASYSGGKLSVSDQGAFDDVFGNIDSNVFGSTRTFHAPISGLQSQKQTLTSQKQAILAQPETALAKSQVSALDTRLGKIDLAQSFLSGKTNKFVLGAGTDNEVTVASRGQGGMIDIKNESVFKDLGVNISSTLKKQKTAAPGKKISTLESELKAREATQKNLISELKIAQTARVKETAAARVAQLDKMVAQRAITRRDAVKLKKEIAKEVSSQNKSINAVDDSVPIPDIKEFDNDLRSEAQKILDSTEGLVKEQKKTKIAGRLRQVTRARKPQSSPVGAVLARGKTVPRPRPAIRQTSTTLGAQKTSLRNPFLSQ